MVSIKEAVKNIQAKLKENALERRQLEKQLAILRRDCIHDKEKGEMRDGYKYCPHCQIAVRML